jgi:hypothetical protein
MMTKVYPRTPMGDLVDIEMPLCIDGQVRPVEKEALSNYPLNEPFAPRYAISNGCLLQGPALPWSGITLLSQGMLSRIVNRTVYIATLDPVSEYMSRRWSFKSRY